MVINSVVSGIRRGNIRGLSFLHDSKQTGEILFTGSVFTIDKEVTFGSAINVINGTYDVPAIVSASGNSGIYFGSGYVGISTAASQRVVVDGQGDINIYGGRGIDSSVTDAKVPWILCNTTDDIAGNVGGAIPIITYCTTISSDAGGDAFTLADGSAIGQLKKILFYVDGGGDAVVTGKFGSGGTSTTLTFSDAGEYALLVWNGSGWVAIELYSVISVAHRPVIS
jgi:hypothetical protein